MQTRGLPETLAGLRADKGTVKCPATGHASHTKDVELLPLIIKVGIGLVPVDLGFFPEPV